MMYMVSILMHGNVWEWCDDVYGEYLADPVVNSIILPSEGGQNYRVLRGGGWFGNAMYCRSARRNSDVTDGHFGTYGFRLACCAS